MLMARGEPLDMFLMLHTGLPICPSQAPRQRLCRIMHVTMALHESCKF